MRGTGDGLADGFGKSLGGWREGGPKTMREMVRLSEIVAANVRWEASRYELRQEDLAQILHCSRTAISQRFTGKVAWTLDEIGRIADALGVKPGYFLEDPVPGAWLLGR